MGSCQICGLKTNSSLQEEKGLHKSCQTLKQGPKNELTTHQLQSTRLSGD